MIYNFNATGRNQISSGLKKFKVGTGLESILIEDTPVTIISGPNSMYGRIVNYNRNNLIINVEKTNTNEQDAYYETWNITLEGEFKKPNPKDTIDSNYKIQTQVENPYIKPSTSYIKPSTTYISPKAIAIVSAQFYEKYKISIIVVLVAVIIGVILFFVNKGRTNSVNNFIAAFGEIL